MTTILITLLLLKLHFIDGGREKELIADLRIARKEHRLPEFMITTVKTMLFAE